VDLHTRAKGILMLPPVAGMWLATSHFSETTLELEVSHFANEIMFSSVFKGLKDTSTHIRRTLT